MPSSAQEKHLPKPSCITQSSFSYTNSKSKFPWILPLFERNDSTMQQQKRPKLAVLMLLFLLSALLFLQPASAAAYRQGSSGQTVTTIQTKLKRWGYYTGSVDGIYGSATVSAVKYFQSSNGLTPDGVSGPATLQAMGISSTSSNATSTHSSSDVALLAKVISAEARGEPYAGQVAVGAVILNRIEHPSFPNSIAGVVYEPGAFTCMVDGQIDQPIADSAYRAAEDALNGSDPTGGAIYYFNPVTATSSWIWSRPLITVIGKHRFCA
jgi:N-acetylmuramoyl-L-alanine amidase